MLWHFVPDMSLLILPNLNVKLERVSGELLSRDVELLGEASRTGQAVG